VVTAVGYAYPWDFLDDPAVLDRVAALDLDAVAVAASYHATRAASPLHPGRRLVDAAHAACYVPVRPEVWANRRLVPAMPAWVPADSFGDARRTLAAAALRVYAWTVLTHNSLLGRANPDLTVRNAFGEGYPYALCPAAPEVVDYCATLVAEIITLGEPDGVVLEACGPFGVTHGGHHDKTDLAGWSPIERQLLSLCFCAACSSLQAAAGLDPAQVAGLVRAAVRAGDRSTSVDDALGTDLAGTLRVVRTGIAHELRAGLVAQAAHDVRVVLHAAADPWATGSFATVAPAVGANVAALVGSCWQAATAEAELRELAGLSDLAGGAAVGGYVRPDVDPGTPAAELAVRYRAAGMTEVHLYHLGLASTAGLRRLAHYREAMRQ
jgi:hypothetical protein